MLLVMMAIIVGAITRIATELFLKGKPQAVVDHLTKLAPLERLGGLASEQWRVPDEL